MSLAETVAHAGDEVDGCDGSIVVRPLALVSCRVYFKDFFGLHNTPIPPLPFPTLHSPLLASP